MPLSCGKVMHFCLPQSDPATALEIPVPRHQYKSYSPSMPPPPNSPLDAQGLRERVEYGRQIRQYRNISPRFMAFLQQWKDQCKALLHGEVKRKDKDASLRKLRVDNDMIRFRYEEVHSPNGLCNALITSMAMLMEIRLMVDYGDYLAESLRQLKTSKLNGFQRRLHPSLNWQEINSNIQAERQALGETGPKIWPVLINTRSNIKTPWLDDIEKAAAHLNTSRDQLIFEIETYAARNNLCHSRIGKLIKGAAFGDLAKHILHDKSILQLVFQDRPQEMAEWRRCIGRIQSQFFETSYMTSGGAATCILTEEAVKRVKRHQKRQQLRRAIQQQYQKTDSEDDI